MTWHDNSAAWHGLQMMKLTAEPEMKEWMTPRHDMTLLQAFRPLVGPQGPMDPAVVN
jgi:hypothetical protein